MRSLLSFRESVSNVADPIPMPPDCVKDFDFDLARAVVEQLTEALASLPVGALTEENLAAMDKRQGFINCS